MGIHAILFISGAFAAAPSAWPQGQMVPAADGYVTRVASSLDFDVNGYRIVCGRKAKTFLDPSTSKPVTNSDCPRDTPYLGERMTIYGLMNDESKSITADLIEAKSLNLRAIRGSAVIDGMPYGSSASAQPDQLLVRADGYWILIDGKTKIAYDPLFHSLADIQLGDWIDYEGTPNGAGIVIASKVKLSPESITLGEENLRAKSAFDPAAVPPDAKQNPIRVAVREPDPKRFPPYSDPAMQARVNEIGNRLIPAYQRKLSDSAPAKIHFQFQVIDTKLFRDVLPLPNGIILVPHQVVERMQNDSQLAAVLADGIASALERQKYRLLPATRTAEAVTVGGLFVPVVGEGIFANGVITQMEIPLKLERQRDRVSLDLLEDAGYDIDQAPIAWWLLAPIKPKPINKIDMPYHAGYLYRILGESWRNPAAGGLEAH
jgi:hypothetical protein